jgi:hypothetical protein
VQVPDPQNACPNFGTTDPNITCVALQPIPYIGEGVLTVSNGYGNYNAFTAKAEKRLSDGVEFISSYSWSHALSDACPALTPCAIFDPTNLKSDYANAEWDIRQNFATGFTYQLPVGKGRRFGAHLNPVLNPMLGGWALNGTLTLRGGIPTLPVWRTTDVRVCGIRAGLTSWLGRMRTPRLPEAAARQNGSTPARSRIPPLRQAATRLRSHTRSGKQHARCCAVQDLPHHRAMEHGIPARGVGGVLQLLKGKSQ